LDIVNQVIVSYRVSYAYVNIDEMGKYRNKSKLKSRKLMPIIRSYTNGTSKQEATLPGSIHLYRG
jgi:hypothetical protein